MRIATRGVIVQCNIVTCLGAQREYHDQYRKEATGPIERAATRYQGQGNVAEDAGFR